MECRANDCAYSDEGQQCFDNCALYPGRELVGLPFLVTVRNSVEECEYLCLTTAECNFFMFKAPFCQIYDSYNEAEEGDGTSGIVSLEFVQLFYTICSDVEV